MLQELQTYIQGLSMEVRGVTIYISGQITDDDDYLEKFLQYDEILHKLIPDCETVNPAWMSLWLPESFSHSDHLDVDLVALKKCDACFFIKDWKNSIGCVQERLVCKQEGIRIIDEDNLIDELRRVS